MKKGEFLKKRGNTEKKGKTVHTGAMEKSDKQGTKRRKKFLNIFHVFMNGLSF